MEKRELNILNKKAGFEYHIVQKYVAGIQLLGTEIKSVRAGNANLSDAYCLFINEELVVRNLNIGIYKQASYNNHEPMRVRKLLLKKTELRKLRTKSSDKGLTIVPMRIFISETGFAKIEIAIASGKKSFDKRNTIKEREAKIELKRDSKNLKIS